VTLADHIDELARRAAETDARLVRGVLSRFQAPKDARKK